MPLNIYGEFWKYESIRVTPLTIGNWRWFAKKKWQESIYFLYYWALNMYCLCTNPHNKLMCGICWCLSCDCLYDNLELFISFLHLDYILLLSAWTLCLNVYWITDWMVNSAHEFTQHPSLLYLYLEDTLLYIISKQQISNLQK